MKQRFWRIFAVVVLVIATFFAYEFFVGVPSANRRLESEKFLIESNQRIISANNLQKCLDTVAFPSNEWIPLAQQERENCYKQFPQN